ncbi:MAG: DUF4290 domain-containing protein [Flavobacteriaceae bacterium]|nr:DUF4290 domain-containing protein [Flavobacteriaceae bacterium]NVJ72174.1 DUF4290 domain-containing protein [Flavobacteriaceae bacterium]
MDQLEHLEYNTERSALHIPEYGRHFQKMVDHAVSIADREERNKTAQAIISVMGNLQPHLRDVPEFQHKLWDQLFIMSNFQLDVDSPFPITPQETLSQKPDPLDYPQNAPKYRFYGNNIKRMIDVAISWEKGDKRDGLELVIANHMKKCYLNWNKDTVDDSVIYNHLLELSNGQINLAENKDELTSSEQILKYNNQQRPQNKKHQRNNNQNRKKRF